MEVCDDVKSCSSSRTRESEDELSYVITDSQLFLFSSKLSLDLISSRLRGAIVGNFVLCVLDVFLYTLV